MTKSKTKVMPHSSAEEPCSGPEAVRPPVPTALPPLRGPPAVDKEETVAELELQAPTRVVSWASPIEGVGPVSPKQTPTREADSRTVEVSSTDQTSADAIVSAINDGASSPGAISSASPSVVRRTQRPHTKHSHRFASDDSYNSETLATQNSVAVRTSIRGGEKSTRTTTASSFTSRMKARWTADSALSDWDDSGSNASEVFERVSHHFVRGKAVVRPRKFDTSSSERSKEEATGRGEEEAAKEVVAEASILDYVSTVSDGSMGCACGLTTDPTKSRGAPNTSAGAKPVSWDLLAASALKRMKKMRNGSGFRSIKVRLWSLFRHFCNWDALNKSVMLLPR